MVVPMTLSIKGEFNPGGLNFSSIVKAAPPYQSARTSAETIETKMQKRWAALLMAPTFIHLYDASMDSFISRHIDSLEGEGAAMQPVLNMISNILGKLEAASVVPQNTYTNGFNALSIQQAAEARNDNISYFAPSPTGPA